MSIRDRSSAGHNALSTVVLPVGTQISALVFDLDGTLYLQAPLRRAMAWRFLQAGLVRPRVTWREWRIVQHYRQAQEHLRATSEPFAARQLPLTCEWSGASPEQAAAVIARWMEEAPLDMLARHVRPGIADLLQTAHEKGIRLGVLSDYPAAAKLRALGLESYFAAVVTAQDDRVRRLKPSPEGLALTLAELGVEPARALYIGDRPAVDGETARRAGVPCLIVGQPSARNGPGWSGVPDIPSLRSMLRI